MTTRIDDLDGGKTSKSLVCEAYTDDLHHRVPIVRARKLITAFVREANVENPTVDPMAMRFRWHGWLVHVYHPPTGHSRNFDAAEQFVERLWKYHGAMEAGYWTFLVWTGMEPASNAPAGERPIMELANRFDSVYEKYSDPSDK